MASVFEFKDYRAYVLAWIANQGTGAHGLKGKIAKAVGVSSSLISQILKGQKSLTPDQTHDLGLYLGLSELESEYLHTLVEVDRAGSIRYKERLIEKARKLRKAARDIGTRVPRQAELTEEQKAVFYSSWLYTGIFNLAAIPEMDNLEPIAKHLHVDVATARRIVNFLIEHGLLRENKGSFEIGPTSIHVDRDSPHVNKHHQNWRIQALQRMEQNKDADLFFTSPMSLSVEAAEEIRRQIPEFIQEVMKGVGPSRSEVAACLNIDWFHY